MKVDEIRALSADELGKQLNAAYQELFDLRFQLLTKKLVNNREIRRARKNIARLRTIVRERELGIRQA